MSALRSSTPVEELVEQLTARLDREREFRMVYGQVALYAESYIHHLHHGDTISARTRFADMSKAAKLMREYVSQQMKEAKEELSRGGSL